MNRFVITVDGHAGSGKTTLSRLLASRLGWAHFSSGLLYRGLGFLALRNGVGIRDESRLTQLLSSHTISIIADSERKSVLLVDNEAQGDNVHLPEVSEAASVVSSFATVRSALINAQKNAFPGSNIVAEGRDMGTVIFPDAPLKFFIEVSIEVRVQRRIVQLGANIASQGSCISEEEIRKEIIERDLRDSQRDVAPTKAASDAIIVDNSTLLPKDIVDFMEQEARKRGLPT